MIDAWTNSTIIPLPRGSKTFPPAGYPNGSHDILSSPVSSLILASPSLPPSLPLSVCPSTRKTALFPSVSVQTLKRLSKDFSPEADFKARGMTKDNFPGRYMYRDQGLKFWDATHTWVKDYLDVS